MKRSHFITVLTVVLFVISCGKNEEPQYETDQNQESTEQGNPSDETPKETEQKFSDTAIALSDNILISGSEKIIGSLPIPNDAITMDVSQADSRGFLNEGFNVSVSSDTNIIGAYIQFKTKDGGVSDSYYKVNFEANKTSLQIDEQTKSNKEYGTTEKLGFDETNVSLDVDFSPRIEPGEFCYTICVFDEAGNISGAQELCVTVLNWGGNEELEGTWSYTKDERYYTDWGTVERILGSNLCYKTRKWYCSTEDSFDYSNCHGWTSLKTTFNQDGTYESTSESYGTYLLIEESEVDCTPVYTTDAFETLETSGTWAYDSEKEEIIQIVYTSRGENQNGPFNNVYEKGDGRLLRRSNTIVAGDSYIFGEDYENPILGLLGFRFFHSKD